MNNIDHYKFMYGFCSYLCYLVTNTSAVCIVILCIANMYLFFKKYLLWKNLDQFTQEKYDECEKFIRIYLYSMTGMAFTCFALYILSAYYRVTLLVYNIPADELLRLSTY